MAAVPTPTRVSTLQPISLSSLLSSSPLPQSAVFRARITSLRPYSLHTKLAHVFLTSLDAPDVKVEVELKGWWADNASKRFRVGETVVLKTKGGKVVEGSKKGKGKEKEGEGKKRLRFEKGVVGWIIRKGGEQEVLRYSSNDRRPLQPTPSKPPPRSNANPPPIKPMPRPRPVSAVSAPAKPATLPRAVPPSPRPVIPRPHKPVLSSIPAKRPAPVPSPPVAAVRQPSPKSGAVKVFETKPVAAPGEGARAVKRKKQEEKLGWDLTTAEGVVYVSPSDFPRVLAEATGEFAYYKKLVNVVVLVEEVGEAWPPRAPGGNYYRKLAVAGPASSSRIDVAFYTDTEEALPNPQVGELLVLHGIQLKSPTSLVAGSFEPVPFAYLSPSHLLSVSPSQHPPPHTPLTPLRPPNSTSGTWRALTKGLQLPLGIWLGEEEKAYARRVAGWFRSEGRVSSMAVREGGGEAEGGGGGEEKGVRARTSVGGGVGAASTGRKLLRVEEIWEGTFCDVIGMVTAYHNASHYTLLTLPPNRFIKLFITDYTSHPLLPLHSASSASSSTGVGIPGRFVFEVSLFGYQASPLLPLLSKSPKPEDATIKRGTLVHLRNVRVKMRDDGEGLEGTMVEEREEKFRHKRDVTVLLGGAKGEREERWKVAMKGVQQRHREYWAAQSLQK